MLAQPCLVLVSMSCSWMPAVCVFRRIMHACRGASFAGPAVSRGCVLYSRTRGELPRRCPGNCHAGASCAHAVHSTHICFIRLSAPRTAVPALAVQVHAEEAPGDILVFLTGQDEIESLARLVSARCAALYVVKEQRPIPICMSVQTPGCLPCLGTSAAIAALGAHALRHN